MLPKITSVKSLQDYVLEVEFSDGSRRQFSVKPYLEYPVYQPLKSENFFKTVIVKYNTVVWGKDEDIDFDPFTIYSEGKTLVV